MKLSVLILFVCAAIARCNANEYDDNDDVYGELGLSQRCVQNLETGVCRAMFIRWGYIAAINKCVEFVYGGCGGNENRFNSKDECEQACHNPFKLFTFNDFE